MGAENRENIAEFPAPRAGLVAESHTGHSIRRCSVCQIRKLLDRGFYRDRKSRQGYRRECKKCRNLVRARWARSRYRERAGAGAR